MDFLHDCAAASLQFPQDSGKVFLDRGFDFFILLILLVLSAVLLVVLLARVAADPGILRLTPRLLLLLVVLLLRIMLLSVMLVLPRMMLLVRTGVMDQMRRHLRWSTLEIDVYPARIVLGGIL